MSSSLSVIIPAFNEAAAIGDVVCRVRETVPDCEILVINDGSVDDTEAQALGAGARVISHKKNRGYGAALATGVRESSSDLVIFIDADGQHEPEDITRLVSELESHDMVVGARQRDSYVDKFRAPGKRVLRVFANYLAREEIPDVNSGFRAFRREVLLQYLHLMPQGFSFSTTSTFVMLKANRPIKWLPIQAHKRVGVSTVRQLKHGPETLMLMLRLTVLFDPLRVFIPVSKVLMLLAVVMVMLNFIFFRYAVPTSAVLFGMSSLIIFLLGLLTEQVSALRRDLHARL